MKMMVRYGSRITLLILDKKDGLVSLPASLNKNDGFAEFYHQDENLTNKNDDQTRSNHQKCVKARLGPNAPSSTWTNPARKQKITKVSVGRDYLGSSWSIMRCQDLSRFVKMDLNGITCVKSGSWAEKLGKHPSFLFISMELFSTWKNRKTVPRVGVKLW